MFEKIAFVMNKLMIIVAFGMVIGMFVFLIKMKAWIYIVLLLIAGAIYFNIWRIRRARFNRRDDEEKAKLEEKKEELQKEEH